MAAAMAAIQSPMDALLADAALSGLDAGARAPAGASFGMGSALSPEQVIQTLVQAVGPGAGIPPPEIVGQALYAAGVPYTGINVARALQEANGGPSAPAPSAETINAAAAGYKAAAAGQTGFAGSPAAERIPRVAGMPSAGMPGAFGAAPAMPVVRSPEDAILALMNAAGPDAGTPPPAVVGVALRSIGVPATAENIKRALRAATGIDPAPEAVMEALEAAATYVPGQY